MTELKSNDEFEHLHKDTLLRLENEKLKLGTISTPVGLQPLDAELKDTLGDIVTQMAATGRLDPETVFRTAISFLPVLDAKRLVIENLLEAAKQGQDISKTLNRYQKLGLLSVGSERSTAKVLPDGLGPELQRRKGLLGRIALCVARIGVNALKSIPKWVEIEPQITLLPFPTLSFTLKGAAISVQDLLDTLADGVGPGAPGSANAHG